MDPFCVAAVLRGVVGQETHMDLGCCSEFLEREDREGQEEQGEEERAVCSLNIRVDVEGRGEQPW